MEQSVKKNVLPEYIKIDDFFNILEMNNIQLTEESVEKIHTSRKCIETIIDSKIPVYGITTGFGELINRLIPKDFSSTLQHNLVNTHATGIGNPIDPIIVRSIMLCRLITLTKGFSGVRYDLVKRLLDFLNHGYYPLVHEKGSLGASGDLSPLSEIAMVLTGKGLAIKIKDVKALQDLFMKNNSNAYIGNLTGHDILKLRHGTYAPIDSLCKIDNIAEDFILEYKEGLSLINGTAGMTSFALFSIRLAEIVYNYSIMATALCLASLRVSSMPFDKIGVSLKGHPEMVSVANHIMFLLDDCKLIRHQDDIMERLKIPLKQGTEQHIVIKTDEYLQNAYSLRVIPQVLGGYLRILRESKDITEKELNGIDDNPIIIPSGTDDNPDTYIYHGANFHGQYIGYAMDCLKIPVIQLAQLSDRRIARLIDANYNDGLTDLLAADSEGLSCGFEGLQYSSTSVVAEMKSKCIPASIQSIPSNLNNQDLVSMGMISARQTFDILKDSLIVVSIEIMTALQAIEMRVRMNHGIDLTLPTHDNLNLAMNEELGSNLYQVYSYYRDTLGYKYVHTDRYLGDDLNKIQYDKLSNIFKLNENNHALFGLMNKL